MGDMFIKSPVQSPKLFEKYRESFKEIKVDAKTVLLREGQIAKNIFFVKSGCLRIWKNHDGKEITFQFFFENEAIASIESFRKNIPSPINIETVEPSALLVLGKKKFELLLEEIPQVKDFLLEMAFRRFDHYANLFHSYIMNNPAGRYRELLKNEPRIIQRVPQHYIASYLGITPVSLSRIRNKISREIS